MDTEQCEEWLQQYTIEIHNVLAERQKRMATPKLHRGYSDLAMINQQLDPRFDQNEIILSSIKDFVNYIEHFHMTNKQVTLKTLLSLYLG